MYVTYVGAKDNLLRYNNAVSLCENLSALRDKTNHKEHC